MVNLIVLGISIHNSSHVPILLLYPMGTTRLLCLHLDPIEAFSVSKALHGFGERAKHSERLFFERSHESKENHSLSREEVILKRPMVHDLLLDSVKSLGGQLLSVSLVDEKEGFYLAEAVVTGPKGTFHIDCRPADAIALALRANIPIRLVNSLMVHTEEFSEIMDSLPEHIQNLARTAMLSNESLLSENKIATPKKSENDSTLEKHLSIEKITQIMASFKKNTLRNAPKDSREASSYLQEKQNIDTLLAPLSDADEWTEVLSSLTPETKELM